VPHAPEPNACEPGLVARVPAELRDLAEAEARERAGRISGLPSAAPSGVLTELVLELLDVSTDVAAEPSRVLAAVIAVVEFVCQPTERTYANAVLLRDIVDTDAGWRRVNGNRAR
jgi:hypothetical protein